MLSFHIFIIESQLSLSSWKIKMSTEDVSTADEMKSHGLDPNKVPMMKNVDVEAKFGFDPTEQFQYDPGKLIIIPSMIFM